ncbi:glycosyltransferase [Microbacterium sp. APC 3898]|uniref:Glycosyltransferase n=1 Tax=Planococcus notacanthi TaxID=3035188 RepID=A0ABT7ZEU4_9BACL|nr:MULTISPECIES: glycosyltransferase [Terrabacteria group]MDN3425674.1 glycosyltransferase [Planococcus sp. APC 4016]MDN3500948.1 glycosyltransferase [Microbacterium sp. APC 3898]
MKYSVLMSVYNKEKPAYLEASLRSMVNQTVKPDEIVIVKDGKLTEELDLIINKFIESESTLFKLLSLEKNVGLGKALDAGLAICKNELVARMDSDDISLEKRCEMQLLLFNKDKELDIVGTMIDEFYDEPKNIISSRIVPLKNHDIKKFIRRRSPFNHPTVMYKKSEVIRVGGYGELRRKQDLDLFSRMINNNCKGENINEALVLFRSNEDNFKRRKSWSYCKSYVLAQYTIWKRGHCNIVDLTIVTLGQIIMFVSPMWLLKWLSNNFLRKTYKPEIGR